MYCQVGSSIAALHIIIYVNFSFDKYCFHKIGILIKFIGPCHHKYPLSQLSLFQIFRDKQKKKKKQ